MAPIDEIQVRRFAELFAGLTSRYFTYRLDGTTRENGKRDGRGDAIQEPITADVWREHLTGGQSLGVIPLMDDGQSVVFGVIDVDVYGDGLPAQFEKVVTSNLPLVPCRSKSGGLHVYLF